MIRVSASHGLVHSQLIRGRDRQGLDVLRHDYHETYPTILWDRCQKNLKLPKDAVVRIGAVIVGTKCQMK